MTSVVIPGLDLVPSLPSRVVTVDLVDMTEGHTVAGAKIDFFLPGDLHVPADDKILQAGRVTLTLNANGHGEIRLPAYTDSVRPVDWVIGVKKHWAPHPYYIRVPQGITKISLTDLEPVQALPQGVTDWMLTGAAVSVTEGTSWGATVALTGGVADFKFTVPPNFDALYRPSPALTLGNTDDLDLITTPGRRKRIISAPAGMNYPPGATHGILDVIDMTPGASTPYLLQIWRDSWHGWTAQRRLYSGVWQSWQRSEPLGTLPARVDALENSSSVPPLGVRSGEHEMRVEGLRQRIGRVSHPGKAVVALVFDHGSQKFQDVILPKLRTHGIKSTLAMCSTQLTLEPSNEVSSWDAVAAWANNDLVEIACHSKTHQDVTGIAALREEIVTSRDELSANLGGLPVDSWVQPGARNVITPGEQWDGFRDGAGAERYYSTPAGEMIWNAYAMATGQVTWMTWNRHYPCTGRPPLGPARRFIDGGTSAITQAKAEIDAAATAGNRYIISLHPTAIGGSMPQAEIEDFIDYLAARQTAGEIALVQLREWALAEG